MTVGKFWLIGTALPISLSLLLSQVLVGTVARAQDCTGAWAGTSDCTNVPTNPHKVCAWPDGAVIPVRLNVASFSSSSTLQAAFERRLQDALDVWNNQGGANIRLRYDGRTTALDPQATFIAVYRKAFGPGAALARLICHGEGYCTSATPSGPFICLANGSNCVDYLQNGDVAPNWCDFPSVQFSTTPSWLPGYPYVNGDVDFQGYLTHELGHALGHKHTDYSHCSVLGCQTGPSHPNWDSEQSRYLSQYDIDVHRDLAHFGQVVATSSKVWLQTSTTLASGWSWLSTGAGRESNVAPAVAYSDGTTSAPNPTLCVAYAASAAPYGIVDQVLTIRHNGSAWEFAQPNSNPDGYVLARTAHGLSVAAGANDFRLALVDAYWDQSDWNRILTTQSDDCRWWTNYQYVPGAHTHTAPFIAYDSKYQQYLVTWVDGDDSQIWVSVLPDATGTWSTPQATGSYSVLAPSLALKDGTAKGTLNYISKNGSLCTHELTVSSSGVIGISASNCTSAQSGREGLGAMAGIDAGGTVYAVTQFDLNYSTLFNRQSDLWKASTSPAFGYVSSVLLTSSSSGPKTHASLTWGNIAGANRWFNVMTW